MRKSLVSVLIISLGLLLLACVGDGTSGNADGPSAAGFPLTIRLSDGQELRLERPPQRIISMAPHATEIFCALGAEDQLVAVERFANCPLDSGTKPAVDAFTPNLEAIAGYRPDLVYVAYNQGGLVDSLRRLDIPVLFVEVPDSLDDVLEHILVLGRAAGRAQEAEALTGSMQERMEAVKRKVSDVGQGPRVFHELDTEYYTAAPNSFIGDFYNYLRARNIAAGASGSYPQLSAEVIIQRNPEVIVLADEAAGVTPAMVRARPGWDVIDAVRNGRICSIDPDIVSRPGPRIVDALEALGKCLYPERF
jgi:iron complex transport system substrate-binding protein